MSDKIESVLNETRRFEPPQGFANANVAGRNAYDALVQEAADDWEGFWARLAREHITWEKPFSQVYDGANAPVHRWFADGELNISANCLDRHLPARAEQAAIIFEDDDGNTEVWSYQRLYESVCRFHAGVRAFGCGAFGGVWRVFRQVVGGPH